MNQNETEVKQNSAKKVRRAPKRQIVAYIASCVLATGVDLGSQMGILSWKGEAGALVAEIVGFVVAAAFSFCAFQLLVFRAEMPTGLHWVAAIVSFLTYALGALFVARTVYGLIAPYVGVGIAAVVCFAAVYTGEYFYLTKQVFRKPEQQKNAGQ